MKNRLKHDLCEDLQRLGFNTRGKTIKEAQELATSQNIPITVEENDIVEGWVGKLKGINKAGVVGKVVAGFTSDVHCQN